MNGPVARHPNGLIVVRLTEAERQVADQAALDRMRVSAEAGLNHESTMPRPPKVRLRDETVGAGAELAWAKIRGQQWRAPINEFHDVPDDGEGFEVRATWRRSGRLIVRDNDDDDRWFVFATGEHRLYIFRGCLIARDAKHPCFLDNPGQYRPSWFAPQGYLLPIPDYAIRPHGYPQQTP